MFDSNGNFHANPMFDSEKVYEKFMFDSSSIYFTSKQAIESFYQAKHSRKVIELFYFSFITIYKARPGY